MNDKIKATKSILIMIIFSFGSKFFGFIRETLIALNFGSGLESDAYFVSLTAVGIVSSFITVAISTSYIPLFSEIEKKEGIESKITHTNNLLSAVFIGTFILYIVAWFIAPITIKILAVGFKDQQFNLTLQLTRIGLPLIMLYGLIGVMTGFLQSERRFISSSVNGLLSNIVYIIFLLFFSDKYGIKGLMFATVLSVISNLIIQLPEVICSHYRYFFKLDLKDEYIKKLVLMSLPVIVGVAIDDINAILDRTMASTLVQGSISALNYANKLNNLILGVFITAIATVIFPMLANESINENYESIKKIISSGINIILLITIPATVGIIVLAKPIVKLIFERGAFDLTATLMTTKALIGYSLGLVPMALKIFITKVFYSLHDTKTPMINGIITLILNLIMNLVLIKFLAHFGLALATSIAVTFSFLILIFDLRKKIGSVGGKSFVICGIKSVLASCVMGLTIYLIYYNFLNYFNTTIVNNYALFLMVVFIGGILYIGLCYKFDIYEIKMIINKLKDKLTNR